MSAATELTLTGQAPFTRNLCLRANAHGYLSAMLYLQEGSRPPTMLAYANAKLADCYLYRGKYADPALWIGSTAFDVTEAEFEQIRAAYESSGLTIQQDSARHELANELRSSVDAAVHP